MWNMDWFHGHPVHATLAKWIRTKQNKCLRVITNSAYNAPTIPMYKSTNILPIEHLYNQHMANFMHKYSHNELPRNLMTLFRNNTEIHQHNTRARHRPHIVRLNTHTVNKTFIQKAPQLWYTIPVTLQNIIINRSFSKKYKKTLIDQLWTQTPEVKLVGGLAEWRGQWTTVWTFFGFIFILLSWTCISWTCLSLWSVVNVWLARRNE